MIRTLKNMLIAALLAPTTGVAGVINVPADQPSIQAALNAAAASGDEIVVAPGTYFEFLNTLGKAVTLRSASGDPADTRIHGSNLDTVIRCVTGEGPGTVIRDLTILAGSAPGNGGGIFIQNASPTISNCVLMQNRAPSGSGGGIYCQNGTPSITDCVFLTANVINGGGIFLDNADATIDNCTFDQNSATNHGGGVYCYNGSDPTITGCEFTGNDAVLDGGGVFCFASSNPTIQGCLFSANTADRDGGAIATFGSSSPAVTDCKFFGNTALTGNGGAIALSSSPAVPIVNCAFTGGIAINGGALYATGGTAAIANCAFTLNTATSSGGACDLAGGITATIDNSILWSNSTSIGSAGPAVTLSYSTIDSIPFGVNVTLGPGLSIVDPDFTDADGADNIAGTPDDDLRLIPGSPCIDAGNNAAAALVDAPAVSTDIDGNPRFHDDIGVPDTGAGAASIVDMGPYEYQYATEAFFHLEVPAQAPTIQLALHAIYDHPASLILVSPGTYTESIDFLGKAVTVRGISSDPSETIIDGAGTSRVVLCNKGEGPDTVLRGFTITGGFVNGVITDPSGWGAGMLIVNSSPTVTDCVFSDNFAALPGHPTISGGRGGGMYCSNSGAAITGCAFTSNEAQLGGGLYSTGPPSLTVTDCTFTSNEARSDGAGLWVDDSSTITDCTFQSNVAAQGGGMYSIGDPTIRNCQFLYNRAFSRGAGLYAWSSAFWVIVEDCRFIGNRADPVGVVETYGGAIVSYNVSIVVTGCEFYENWARFGSAISGTQSNHVVRNCVFSTVTAFEHFHSAYEGSHWAAFPSITNCSFSDGLEGHVQSIVIFAPPSGSSIVPHMRITNCVLNSLYVWSDAEVSIASSNYQGLFEISHGIINDEGGNISADPLFVDVDGPDGFRGTVDDDLRLSPLSPCIDAGDNTAPALAEQLYNSPRSDPVPAITADLDGNPRFHDDSGTPDTGVGPAPVVDMGSYEFQGTSVPPCDGDADGNGVVDVNDIAYVIFRLGNSGASGTVDGDADGNGVVDVNDIGFVIFRFGQCL